MRTSGHGEDWLKSRYGWATASRLADLMAKTKTGVSASRAKYMAQVCVERMTGQPYDSGFTSAAMARGIELEPIAIAAYEADQFVSVEPAKFVPHPRIKWAGASPDGLVGADGLVECKCPETHTHLETLDGKKIDRRYMLQMQFQMACAEREWCDYVSFDDRLPGALALHVRRVERDDKMIAEIESEVEAFLAEAEERLERYREMAA